MDSEEIGIPLVGRADVAGLAAPRGQASRDRRSPDRGLDRQQPRHGGRGRGTEPLGPADRQPARPAADLPAAGERGSRHKCRLAGRLAAVPRGLPARESPW